MPNNADYFEQRRREREARAYERERQARRNVVAPDLSHLRPIREVLFELGLTPAQIQGDYGPDRGIGYTPLVNENETR